MNLDQVQIVANTAQFQAAMRRAAEIVSNLPPNLLTRLTQLREQRDRDNRRAIARRVHIQYHHKSRGHR